MPATKDDQPLTDMGYPLYPPSLYRACSYAAGLGVPVYVMVSLTCAGMPPGFPEGGCTAKGALVVCLVTRFAAVWRVVWGEGLWRFW